VTLTLRTVVFFLFPYLECGCNDEKDSKISKLGEAKDGERNTTKKNIKNREKFDENNKYLR